MGQPTDMTEAAQVVDFETRATKDQNSCEKFVRHPGSIGQNRKPGVRGRMCRLAVWALALMAFSSARSDADVVGVFFGYLYSLAASPAYQCAGVLSGPLGTQAAIFEIADPGPGSIGFDYSSTVIVLPGYPFSLGAATNQSADGTTVVGYLDNGSTSPYHAFRKKNTDDAVDLGTLDPSNNATLFSFAAGANSDGSVVVGFSDLGEGDNFNQHAFRWTETEGMVDLGSPNGAGGFSRAFGVSGDGSVVVGEEGDRPFRATRPFLWTAAAGFQDLGSIGSAYAATADGSAVVGQMNSPSTAFLWTQAGGMQDLGTLPGYSWSVATAVSDDGQVVVGTVASRPMYRDNLGYNFGIDCRPFVWTAATGMQDLNQVMANAGVDMTGITLFYVTGISSDGQIVCGAARTPSSDPTDPNQTTGFVAHLLQ